MVKNVFSDHCVNKHNWGKYPCPNKNCKFVSYSQGCFKSHTRTHIGENTGRNLTHTCTRKNCVKKFQYINGLENHLKIHDNDVIRCVYCQWAGIRHYHYCIHMNTHFRNKTYKCQFCPQAFYESNHLSRHMELHEQDTEKYSCHNCDFKTYSYNSMNHHKRICK